MLNSRNTTTLIVHVKGVVSMRLDHARASITLNVYGHLILSLQAESAEKIDELVTPVAAEFDHNKIGS